MEALAAAVKDKLEDFTSQVGGRVACCAVPACSAALRLCCGAAVKAA